MHLTFKNPSNPFQIVNIGKISDSYSISFVTSTTLDNYIVPAQFLDGHLDQDYFGYPFLKGFVRGFTSFQIPPTVNTDNKTVADGEQVGIVESEGEALTFDECNALIFALSCYIKFYDSRCDIDSDTYNYHFDRAHALTSKINRMKMRFNDDIPF